MKIKDTFIVARVDRVSKARCLSSLKYNDYITLEVDLSRRIKNTIEVYVNGVHTGQLYTSTAETNLSGYVLHRVLL